MNVVLYFKRIRDVRKFSIVSKNCHEAIKGMKINPIMNYAKKLKYRKVYVSLIFRLFPNIQTIQIPDYSYPIPNEIVSKLSFIRLLNKMNLTEGRIHRNKIENEPPTFSSTNSKYFYYNIHEKYMLKNKVIDTTNQSYYHSLGNEIHTEINDEIISKLQEYEIYSYETVMFFLKHHNTFKSLKSLYIVIDKEIKTKNTIENEYNLLIFAILSRIKTLKNVYIHSCKAIINNDYINYIESYPFIKFTFIIYTFIQNQHEIYIKLKSMFNVQLIFHCFHPLLLPNGFVVSPNIVKSELTKINTIQFGKNEKTTTSTLKLLCSQFINVGHYPKTLQIEHFEMNSKLDLVEMKLIEIEINLYSIIPQNIFLPSTLTSLVLSINDDSIDSVETPKLQLHNCNLKTLILKGFKYEAVEYLTMLNLPNYFEFEKCENIEIQCTSNKIDETLIPIESINLYDTKNIKIKSSNQYDIPKINMEYCEHINIQTLTQQIQNENEIIIDNISDVRIFDNNIIKYTFSNIFYLNLNTITHLIDIQLPTTLQTLMFKEIRNVNNIQIPNISQIQHLITSLQHIPLTKIDIENIQHTKDMLTFTIPTTIEIIAVENCSNILIQSEDEISIDDVQYSANTNCKFKNISFKYEIPKYKYATIKETGIKFNNVYCDREIYYIYHDDLTQDLVDEELEDVNVIGNWTFSNITLKSVTIPNNVKEMRYRCFQNSYYLQSIQLSTSLTSMSRGCFGQCTSLTLITLPDSLISIGDYCFSNCISLTSITLPDSLVSIGEYCFGDCISLTSITLPYSLKSIGEKCFLYCKSLQEITLPSSLTSIGDDIFECCTSLTSIHYNSLCTNHYNKTIPFHQIKHVKLPQLQVLPSYIFERFNNLTSFKLPTTLIECDDYAFKGCSILSTITIPTNVTKIGKSCFQYCDNLHSIHLHQSLIIDKWCFNMKTALTSIILPTTVTKLHQRFFYGCKSLQLIELPNTIQSFGKSCFNGCESLQSITIPPLVKTIPTLCFNECYQLSTISFGNIETIQSNAFQYCSSLTTLSLPKSLKTLENDTFSYLHITSITLPPLLTTIPDNCFYCCQFLTTITIPTTITSIGSYCFAYCFSLKTMILPTTITRKGDNIFYNCPSLN